MSSWISQNNFCFGEKLDEWKSSKASQVLQVYREKVGKKSKQTTTSDILQVIEKM